MVVGGVVMFYCCCSCFCCHQCVLSLLCRFVGVAATSSGGRVLVLLLGWRWCCCSVIAIDVMLLELLYLEMIVEVIEFLCFCLADLV